MSEAAQITLDQGGAGDAPAAPDPGGCGTGESGAGSAARTTRSTAIAGRSGDMWA